MYSSQDYAFCIPISGEKKWTEGPKNIFMSLFGLHYKLNTLSTGKIA
jgi:hypothetical protein